MDKYKVLKEYFGYNSFKEGQEEAIDSILSGRDVLCVMPTGAGKSLCYQIPALVFPGVTLVISPLISLMRDQVTSLESAGVRAAFINSSLTAAQYHETMERLIMGWYKIIFIAPERLFSKGFSSILSELNISFIAVDEAHCISQWGQDFRPSYLGIKEFAQSLPARPIIGAYTATATKQVADDIVRLLSLDTPFRVTTGFDRPNLHFSVIRPNNKDTEVLKLLSDHQNESGIIYCSTRKDVETLCDTLCAHGIEATRYHAGLTDIERKTNQEDFLFDKKPVMVATNAFGMGIDKSNVSFVIHYQMPKDMESYYQEAGRAGRDGNKADCILLYNPRDVRICRFLIDNNSPNPQLDAQEQEELKEREIMRLGLMTSYCTTGECLRAYILRYFGEKTPQYCGNCSNCEKGSKTVDITLDAKKIISCIVRSGRNYGIKMITDILLGRHTDRIDENGLSQISTFGLMSGTEESWIRKVIESLLYQEVLFQTSGEYPVLKLAQKAVMVVKEDLKVTMELPASVQAEEQEDTEPDTGELFAELKKLRLKLSIRASIPAYAIFTDATLFEICKKLPKNKEEFLEVSGVGRAKLARFGNDFLKCIEKYNPQPYTASQGNIKPAKNTESKLPWSEEEDEILRNEARDMIPVSYIARSHNRSRSSVIRRMQVLGLTEET